MCGLVDAGLRINVSALEFAALPPIRSGSVADVDLAGALSVLSATPADAVAAEWIDLRHGWVGILLSNADAVPALEPNVRPRVELQCTGVDGLYEHGADAAIEVRAFFNDGGGPLREDPVMGSLKASVAKWLTSAGRVKAPYVACQGAKVGRAGRVQVTEAEGQLWTGGQAVVTAFGTACLILGSHGLTALLFAKRPLVSDHASLQL